MKRAKLTLAIILIIPVLFACGGQQGNIKPEDEARAMVAAFQKSLSLGFDGAKAYVAAHPEKQAEWKAKVVPMFDAANKILADLITKGKSGGKLTTLDVTTAVSDKMNEITQILIQWGVVK